MAKKLKVLMVIADQFRADLLDGELADHVDLPNIRAFQKEAVTFNSHFSVTNPCGPSRASIFTGLYAMNHRSVRNGTPMAHDTPNIAREMRKSGYEPRLYGYSDTARDPRHHHADDPALTTEEQVLPGFNEVLEMRLMESYPWRAHLKAQGYDLPSYAHFYDSISPTLDRAARPDDPPFYRAEHSDTAFLTNTLLEDLAVRIDQCWFAVATYIRPHPPLTAPAPYNKMYNPDSLPMPARLDSRAAEAQVHPFMKGALEAPTMAAMVRGCQVDHNTDADVQALRAVYLGLASEVDAHFGRIITFLKKTGQYDDTLIIFMADHGELLGEHHMWGKQNPYDGAYQVPLVIRDPRTSGGHGSVVNALSESVDITPTILDLVGADIPAGMDGASLRPLLEGQVPKTWRDAVHLELDFSEPDKLTPWQKATGTGLRESSLAILREERWKLVHFNGGLAPLLFDLQSDPKELNNLAGAPEHAQTLLRLTQKLLSHRMSHADQTLTGYKITSDGAKYYTQT